MKAENVLDFEETPAPRYSTRSPRGYVHGGLLTELAFALANLLVGRRRRSPRIPTSPRSVGILRTGYVGDVVLASGMIRCIREHWPAAEIHFFCYPSVRPLLEGHPRVEKVWAEDWFPFRRVRDFLRLSALRGMWRFARDVRRARVEVLFVPCRQHSFLGTLKVAMIVWMIQPKMSIGLAYGNRGFFLDRRVRDAGWLVKHESEWCDDLLRAAGVRAGCSVPDILVRPDDARVSALLAEAGIGTGERFVIIHPGGGRDGADAKALAKRWPASYYGRVAAELAHVPGLRVVVTGVPSERPLSDEMRNSGASGFADLMGLTTLGQFAVLARRAALVIGNDCGAIHVASAAGAPTIVIFGPSDPVGFRPLGQRVCVLRNSSDCPPCYYWFEKMPCPRGYGCIRGVTPDAVVACAKNMLNLPAHDPAAPPGHDDVEVSIGITTWNRRDLVLACLASIYRHPPSVPFEVIVVDNASADGTADAVGQQFPQVRLVRNRENRGWTGGCNQVAALSRGRYVVLLNEDTTVEGDAFGALARSMARWPRAGIAAPRLVWPDGTRQPSCRPFPDPVSLFLRGTGLGRTIGRQRLARYLGQDIDLGEPRRVDWALGACLMVKREVFERVGLLDERLSYHDDTDFCYRARRAGYEVVFFPEVTVVHHYQRRSARSWLSAARWKHILSIARLFMKHGVAMRDTPTGRQEGCGDVRWAIASRGGRTHD